MLRERLAAAGLELVGGFVPMRFSDADGFDEDAAGAAPHARPLRRRRRRRARGRCCATRAGPSASRTPGAAARTPRCGSTTRAGGCSRPTCERAADDGARARLRAGLPPPHVDLRRGRCREIERLLEDTDVALLLDSGHLARRRRRPGGRAARLARAHRRGPHQGRAARRARDGQGGARRHPDRLAARPVLRARRRRRRPRRLLRRAHRARLRRLGRGRAGPRARRRRRLRRRERRAGAPTASGCASTPDGEPRRPHHGPHQRRRLPAADRRLAARGRAVRQVPRRQPDQRRGRRRAPRPRQRGDHAHGRGPVRRVPPRRAAGLRRRRPLRHRRCRA